ncbi:hypothetical protein E2I00_004205, partial [Balaenoptera physalus]
MLPRIAKSISAGRRREGRNQNKCQAPVYPAWLPHRYDTHMDTASFLVREMGAGTTGAAHEVVKVVGSNISHKLRLSRVKPTDEGTYECRVIDFSDGKARHHK